MSTSPTVAMGFGYALKADDTSFVNKMKDIFSDFAKDFTDSDGNLTDTAFLAELQYTPDFRQRYKGLDFGVIESVSTGKPLEVIVYRIGSVEKLYSKYDGGINEGVVFTADKNYEETAFELFAVDFGISTKPQQMIWSYWS